MNYVPKAIFWSGVTQDLLQLLSCRIKGTRLYHKSALKTEVVWHNHSQVAENNGAKPTDACAHIEKTRNTIKNVLSFDFPTQDFKDVIRESNSSRHTDSCNPLNNDIVPERIYREAPLQATISAPPQPPPCDSPSASVSLSTSDGSAGHDASSAEAGRGTSSAHSGPHWEVPAGGGPPIPWDEDLAAECERSTLLSAPRPPLTVPEQRRQAEPAAEAELRQLASGGQLSAALGDATVLSAAGTPPTFQTLSLLADEAARRADTTAFERARRLAARLYPVNYGRAARLRASQLELLWRRRLFAPACALVTRYRTEPVRTQLMARRFAVCCCLAAREGIDDALPHIQVSCTDSQCRAHSLCNNVTGWFRLIHLYLYLICIIFTEKGEVYIILGQRISQSCSQRPVPILYFVPDPSSVCLQRTAAALMDGGLSGPPLSACPVSLTPPLCVCLPAEDGGGADGRRSVRPAALRLSCISDPAPVCLSACRGRRRR